MSGHVDQVDPETAEAMRERIRLQHYDRADADWVDELSDIETLGLYEQTYGDVEGFDG
jgi:hypothetical protein